MNWDLCYSFICILKKKKMKTGSYYKKKKKNVYRVLRFFVDKLILGVLFIHSTMHKLSYNF